MCYTCYDKARQGYAQVEYPQTGELLFNLNYYLEDTLMGNLIKRTYEFLSAHKLEVLVLVAILSVVYLLS